MQDGGAEAVDISKIINLDWKGDGPPTRSLTLTHSLHTNSLTLLPLFIHSLTRASHSGLRYLLPTWQSRYLG